LSFIGSAIGTDANPIKDFIFGLFGAFEPKSNISTTVTIIGGKKKVCRI